MMFSLQLTPEQVGMITFALESAINQRKADCNGRPLSEYGQRLIDTHVEIERQWRAHVEPPK